MTAPIAPTLVLPSEMAPLGLSRDARHVYSWNDGTTVVHPLPSVTTAIGAVDKSGPLISWAKRETAACAVRNLSLITDMVRTGGPDSAVKWLSRIPDYQRDLAADLGSRVHALADAVGRSEPVQLTDQERPFLDAYRAFLTDKRPVIERSEAMVCNLAEGYAGTLDLIVKLDGKRWLLDIKTGKAPYAEAGLQLAAYAKAEFIGAPNDPVKHRMPPCTRFGVLHLRPEGYRVVEYGVDSETWQAFLAALKVARWLAGQARTIVGGGNGT